MTDTTATREWKGNSPQLAHCNGTLLCVTSSPQVTVAGPLSHRLAAMAQDPPMHSCIDIQLRIPAAQVTH